MNRASAIRTARTAITGAQNGGRQDTYQSAVKMGIKMKKKWLATLDSRTRHSHAMMDGEIKEVGKKYSNGCRYPGDPHGKPHEIYNCRCTEIAVLDDVDTSDAQRRARDTETGESVLVSNMTYQEWAGWKEKTVTKTTVTGTAERKTDAESTVQTIGKININKFRVVTDGIRTDEVVITNERIEHIQQRHPNDYERYAKYIGNMLINPQYILEDSTPNTAVILQEFEEAGEQFRLILRLAVQEDAEYKKNSVITFLKISEKKFRKYLRNKKILYKSE